MNISFPHQEEYNNLTCHIVGLNPISKKELFEELNKKVFNPIDLDEINQEIINDNEMDKMYKQYQKFKDTLNDKFKEVDKKMSAYWENKFLELLNEKVKIDKKNILIGQNTHYKYLNKKINLNTPNKFIIQSNEDDIKKIIQYNLETFKDDIINGKFPLEYLNSTILTKKKDLLLQTYRKFGYLEKDFKQLKTILNLLETKIIDIPGLWISLKEPYNIGSKIHPKKNDKLIAYIDSTMALIASFNFDKNKLIKNYNGKEIKIKELQPKALDKLKSGRFLYLVSKESFIPHEKGANKKFFSQTPVTILQKEKISNIYNYLVDNKDINDVIDTIDSKKNSKKSTKKSSKKNSKKNSKKSTKKSTKKSSKKNSKKNII